MHRDTVVRSIFDHGRSIRLPREKLYSIPSRTKVHKKRYRLLWSLFIPLIVLSGFLVNWGMLIPPAFAAPLAPTSASGNLTVQQFLQEGQASRFNQNQFQRPMNVPGALPVHTPATRTSTNTATSTAHLPSIEPASMQDQAFTLDDSFVLHRPAMRQSNLPVTVQGTAIPAGTTPLITKGNDGRLEVQVPRGAFDATHAALADGSAPVGQLILRIHQVSGHFIEADSILGTYVLQIVDSQGNVMQGVQLVHPITLVYHYQTWEMTDLNLNPNQVHLSWLAPQAGQPTTSTVSVHSASASTQPSSTVVPMTNNALAQTLTAQNEHAEYAAHRLWFARNCQPSDARSLRDEWQ